MNPCISALTGRILRLPKMAMCPLDLSTVGQECRRHWQGFALDQRLIYLKSMRDTSCIVVNQVNVVPIFFSVCVYFLYLNVRLVFLKGVTSLE